MNTESTVTRLETVVLGALAVVVVVCMAALLSIGFQGQVLV
jgi:hypothetical protein